MFENKKIHMIGIGGISMSGIAMILKSFNASVTGYDATKTSLTENLEKSGIKVTYETNLKNVKDADIIIYTAAIHEDNEELKYARKENKCIYERSTALGLLMKEYENVLCISGTHGKSTTTGMVSTIFMKAGLNPTIMIGAILPIINSNNHIGSKKYFIAESCEYVDSFLEFYPTSEIVLDIDDDHLDYFKNIEGIISSFKKFTNKLNNNGNLIINNDDENTVLMAKDENKITYGINNNSNYMAKNISYNENGHASYDLFIDGSYIDKINLSVSGIHNVYNSLAAIAMCKLYDISLENIKDGLRSYTGVGRRFELIGKYNDALVYDDYAHHPSEIKTTLDSVKKVNHNKDYAIFQSHTYSRTIEHLNEFADVLSKFDNIIIAPIYPAREKNIWGVKEEMLVDLIKEKNPNVIYLDSFDKIKNYIKSTIKPNDLVITIGAGPINEVAKEIVNE